MVQEIIVGLIFLAAVIYFIRHFWQQTHSPSGCSSSCGCESFEAAKKMKKGMMKKQAAEA